MLITALNLLMRVFSSGGDHVLKFDPFLNGYYFKIEIVFVLL